MIGMLKIKLNLKMSDNGREHGTTLLTEKLNRQLLDNIFKFFTQADVDVCCGYAKHYLPTFKQPEIRMMLVSYASMEAVHQEAYSLLLETLGKSDEQYQEFMDIQEMVEKHEYLTDFNMNSPHEHNMKQLLKRKFLLLRKN